MKILHVCESVTGGPASYLNEILQHQVKKYGANNVLVLLPKNQISEIFDCGAKILFYRRTGRNLKSLFNLAVAYLSIVNNEGVNIVHLHSTYAGAVGRLSNFLAKRKPSVIYCAHCWYFDRPSKSSFVRLVVLFERMLAKVTDAIVNISPHERFLLSNLGFRHDIQNDIYTGISDSPIGGVQPLRECKSSKVRLLFVGRLDEQKGVDLLLSCLSKIDPNKFEVTIVGKSVVNKGVNFSFPDYVRRIDWLPRDAIFRLMAESDFLMMPSRWEGFSIAVLEALRSGLPLLLNDILAFRALIGMLKNGNQPGRLIDYSDSQSFIQTINSIDLDEWRKMSGNARDAYINHFRAEAMLDGLDHLYSKLYSK